MACALVVGISGQDGRSFLDCSKEKAIAFMVSISKAIILTITFSSVIYPIVHSSTSAYPIEKVA